MFFTGLLCHLDDACTSNPCHADAICDTSPINGSYTCSCASGYKGVDCSEDINECEQGMIKKNKPKNQKTNTKKLRITL